MNPTARSIQSLTVKIFGDGANIESMLALYQRPFIRGFTTNPTLMRKANVTDYRAFAREALAAIPDRPISFEVFSDDFREMERQAREIAGWGEHVYVKVPVTNTKREPAYDLIRGLSKDGVKVNVTAMTTLDQLDAVADAVKDGAPSYASIFAGRVADTGIDPVPMMAEAVRRLARAPRAELIWASPRELLNIFQADQARCHIITVTDEILKKLPMVGRCLDDCSLDTVRMFHDDALAARFVL